MSSHSSADVDDERRNPYLNRMPSMCENSADVMADLFPSSMVLFTWIIVDVLGGLFVLLLPLALEKKVSPWAAGLPVGLAVPVLIRMAAYGSRECAVLSTVSRAIYVLSFFALATSALLIFLRMTFGTQISWTLVMMGPASGAVACYLYFEEEVKSAPGWSKKRVVARVATYGGWSVAGFRILSHTLWPSVVALLMMSGLKADEIIVTSWSVVFIPVYVIVVLLPVVLLARLSAAYPHCVGLLNWAVIPPSILVGVFAFVLQRKMNDMFFASYTLVFVPLYLALFYHLVTMVGGWFYLINCVEQIEIDDDAFTL